MARRKQSRAIRLTLLAAVMFGSSACRASAQNAYQPTQDELHAALVRYYHTGDSPTTAAVLSLKLNRCDPAMVGGVNGYVCSFCAVIATQGMLTINDRSKSVLKIELHNGSVGMARVFSAEQRTI